MGKILKTLHHFISTPGFTLRFYIEKVLRKLKLYNSPRVRLLNFKMARFIDSWLTKAYWSPRLQRWFFIFLTWVFLFIKKNQKYFGSFFHLIEKNKNHKSLILLDHFFNRQLSINESLFTLSYMNAFERTYFELKGFSNKQLDQLILNSVNKNKKELTISWSIESLSISKERLQEIGAHYQNLGLETLHIRFFGEKVELWEKLSETCVLIRKEAAPYFKKIIISINSDLSSPLDFWKVYHHLFDLVVVNFYPQKSNLESFLKILVFLQYRHPFICNIFPEDNSSEKINLLLKSFKDFNFYQYHFHTFEFPQNGFGDAFPLKEVQTLEPDFISDTLGIRYRVYSNDLNMNNLKSFKGWECHLHHTLVIDESGMMTHAHCQTLAPLGRVSDTTALNFQNAPLICPRELCPNLNDRLISKSRQA